MVNVSQKLKCHEASQKSGMQLVIQRVIQQIITAIAMQIKLRLITLIILVKK